MYGMRVGWEANLLTRKPIIQLETLGRWEWADASRCWCADKLNWITNCRNASQGKLGFKWKTSKLFIFVGACWYQRLKQQWTRSEVIESVKRCLGKWDHSRMMLGWVVHDVMASCDVSKLVGQDTFRMIGRMRDIEGKTDSGWVIGWEAQRVPKGWKSAAFFFASS